jgi:beta-lactamase class A
LERKLLTQIEAIDAHLNGALGVAAIDLYNGRTILYNAETVFPAASTIKVPILIEMFRLARAGGEFRLSDPVTLQPSEIAGGSGYLQDTLNKSGPVTLTIEELLTKMIVDSDNTAANRVIGLARMERVNRLIQEFGAPQTRLRRIMMDSSAAAKGNENVTTPLEMARILEALYRNQAASPADSAAMLEILKRVPGETRSVVPAEIPVALKTGDLPGVHCEVAIVYLENRPFVLSIYSSFLSGPENPLRPVAQLFFDHFQRLAKSNSYGNQVR